MTLSAESAMFVQMFALDNKYIMDGATDRWQCVDRCHWPSFVIYATIRPT